MVRKEGNGRLKTGGVEKPMSKQVKQKGGMRFVDCIRVDPKNEINVPFITDL